jgi:3-hydroxyisobutyrate dehydrogenase
MGLPMAGHLLKAGYQVKVSNRSPTAVDVLVAQGAQAATQRTVASGVCAIVTMLPSGAEVMQVLSGSNGLIASAAKGTLFIDASTIDVQMAQSLAEQAHEAGMKMVDAPVSGGVAKAQAGTLTFMVGGAQEELELARPYLRAMGQTIIHAGASGSGQAAKACNNMMLAICMIAVSEAFTLAERVGLDPKTLLEICNNSSGQSWALRLSQAAAESSGARTPLGALATRLYKEFVESGNGELDFSAIIKHIAS